jgi:hypothetical protein
VGKVIAWVNKYLYARERKTEYLLWLISRLLYEKAHVHTAPTSIPNTWHRDRIMASSPLQFNKLDVNYMAWAQLDE